MSFNRICKQNVTFKCRHWYAFFSVLSGFVVTYIDYFNKSYWSGQHWFPKSKTDLVYPVKYQTVISLHAFTMAILYIIMVIQICLHNYIPYNIHRYLGYFSIIWFPITYTIGCLVIFIRPLKLPWMGMGFAFLNMSSIVSSYIYGIQTIFQKKYRQHQNHMIDSFCMMTAPAYIRIVYIICSKMSSHHDYSSEEICKITNRGFVLGMIVVIILSRIPNKTKSCSWVVLVYTCFEETLLYGCNL